MARWDSACLLVYHPFRSTSIGVLGQTDLRFIEGITNETNHLLSKTAVGPGCPIDFPFTVLMREMLQQSVAKGSVQLKVLSWRCWRPLSRTIKRQWLEGYKQDSRLNIPSFFCCMDLRTEFTAGCAQWMVGFLVEPKAYPPSFVGLVEHSAASWVCTLNLALCAIHQEQCGNIPVHKAHW